ARALCLQSAAAGMLALRRRPVVRLQAKEPAAGCEAAEAIRSGSCRLMARFGGSVPARYRVRR
ncbi:MAG TPA: hypothetical protein VME47_01925, partial [Acetobacteraceae bacterium]|nr:hypothetical protein [Acetobacteraceae bacterium]